MAQAPVVPDVSYQRPIDTLKGALKSKSILLFILLQIGLGVAQPYLASTGVDPLFANMAIDIAAVIVLRIITKASLAEKGSGLEKAKELLGAMDQFIMNPYYKPLILNLLKQKGIEIAPDDEPAPRILKTVKINGKMFYALSDGSYSPTM